MSKFGFLFQGGALFDSLSIWENVAFRLIHQNKMSKIEAKKIAINKLNSVGLSSKVVDLLPSELSGGMQKRVSLARAIASNPEIIFFDEPTTGLDPQARRNLWDLIQEIRSNGTTVIITTHYMDEAEVLCDRVAIIDSGKIIGINAPNQLIDELVATGFEKVKEVKKANLEDVFIHLTGKQLREA